MKQSEYYIIVIARLVCKLSIGTAHGGEASHSFCVSITQLLQPTSLQSLMANTL